MPQYCELDVQDTCMPIHLNSLQSLLAVGMPQPCARRLLFGSLQPLLAADITQTCAQRLVFGGLCSAL